jgi:hypothetical protein
MPCGVLYTHLHHCRMRTCIERVSHTCSVKEKVSEQHSHPSTNILYMQDLYMQFTTGYDGTKDDSFLPEADSTRPEIF